VQVLVARSALELKLTVAPPLEPGDKRRALVVFGAPHQRLAQVLLGVAPDLAALADAETSVVAPRGRRLTGRAPPSPVARTRSGTDPTEGLHVLTGSTQLPTHLLVFVDGRDVADVLRDTSQRRMQRAIEFSVRANRRTRSLAP
jgi:hypothetical protein